MSCGGDEYLSKLRKQIIEGDGQIYINWYTINKDRPFVFGNRLINIDLLEAAFIKIIKDLSCDDK